MGPQLRRRLPQRLQYVRRGPQTLRQQQPPGLRGQKALQGAGGRHQHRLSAPRLPKAIASVPQGHQRDGPAIQTGPDRQKPARHPMPGGGPERHRQHQIGCRRGSQQHLGVHIRVKNAVHHRHPAPRQQSHRQHAPGHGAGDHKQQQRQPEKPLLPAKGRHSQQHTRRHLHRRGGQESPSRQKHRCGIGSSGQGRQQIPPPPEGDSRQPARYQQKQIIHHRV